MLNNNLKALFTLIPENNYITAEKIASELKISRRTVRIRIKELSDVLKKYNMFIESKPRYGYTLVVNSAENLEQFLEKESTGGIPDTTEERTCFLLLYLINHEDFIKLDDLSDFLYVSKTTLSNSIKQVEVILNSYEIYLERKPNYGIRAVGDEFDFRRCIVDNIIRYKTFESVSVGHRDKASNELANIVMEWMQKYHIKLSEVAFENLVEHIYVMIRRVKNGRFIKEFQKEGLSETEKERESIYALGRAIEQYGHIVLPESEYIYITLHVAGRRMVGTDNRGKSNFVIREQIDRLVLQMMDLIYEDFKIDLRSNFDLRLSLNQHMVPLDIRLKYNITLKNPLLDEVKSSYSFAYTMAAHAASVLANYYHREISEDEIGYLALIFELVLEQREGQLEKHNILIVCSSGKGSSKLLMHKYQQEFGNYIAQIYICDLLELERFDFSKAEYIFTTVPITISVPLPIFEISLFLEKRDIVAVREVLEKGNRDFLNDYYNEDAFFTCVKGETREEVLGYLCGEIKKQKDLPDNFFEAVMEREYLGATDFGNLVAIPHPIHIVPDETFVYVAILEKPILWTNNMVQVVFLTAVSDREDENLQKFYQTTTSFLLSKEGIRELIEKRNFQSLMDLLRKQG